MGKKKRPSVQPKLRPSSLGQTSATGGKPGGSPQPENTLRLTGWKLWLGRLGLVLVVPVLILATGEGALRLAGWGYPTTFYLCHRAERVYTDNDRYLCQFYSKQTRNTNLKPIPFSVAMDKPPGAIRIVILGESAAAGAPEPAYSFGRVLERMLRQQYPQRRIDVINAAMRGVNSHILLPTAKDCLSFNPDLFVVYMGNNEAVGLHAPGPRSGRLTPHLQVLRCIQWVRSTRLGELLEPVLHNINREGASSDAQDNAFFQEHRVAADDPKRAAVYHNFRVNLADICQSAGRAGVPVVLATVAGNLKDSPPFGSLHRRNLSTQDQANWENSYAAGIQAETAEHFAPAIEHYKKAANIDDHFAELHFRKARCHFSVAQFEEARTEYGLACDWDALQFRTDTRENKTIRQQGASATPPQVLLVDAERAFRESELAEEHIPGQRLFYDHVHLTFDGAYLLARTMLSSVTQALAAKLGAPNSEAAGLSRDECAEQLAFTRINEAQLVSAVAKLTALPPFTGQFDHTRRQAAAEKNLMERFGNVSQQDFEKAASTFRKAISQTPDDWQLPYNLARALLMPSRAYDSAIAQLQSAGRLLPFCLAIRLELARALLSAGKRDQALAELNQVLQSDPTSKEARAGIAAVERSKSQTAGAGKARSP
jgi:tetratricopeptide (TPR) repeat protein